MNKKLKFLGTTIPIGTYMGIPLKLHWTFFLIFLISFSVGHQEGLVGKQQLILLLLFLFVFLSVTLHEYGHAWAARQFGIKTRDIILSPIGGVARLSELPREGKKELKIAIAGPLVNLVIFIVLAIPLGYLHYVKGADIGLGEFSEINFKIFLLLVASSNLGLFLFNLIPAFPMDGGRILRALLSMNMSYIKATTIASWVGKILAVVGIILGIYYSHYVGIAVAIFIFMMADLETKNLRYEESLNQLKAKDIMRIDVVSVFMVTRMEKLINNHLDSDGQSEFIVLNQQGKLLGVVTKESIETAMRNKSIDAPVANFITQRYGIVNVEDNLTSIIDLIRKNGFTFAVVMDYGKVVGIIDVNMINNVIENHTKKLESQPKGLARLFGS